MVLVCPGPGVSFTEELEALWTEDNKVRSRSQVTQNVTPNLSL